MNEISPQQLLSQIRTMHAELQAPAQVPAAGQGEGGFGTLFRDAVNQVNETQMQAAKMKRRCTHAPPHFQFKVFILRRACDVHDLARGIVRSLKRAAYQLGTPKAV